MRWEIHSEETVYADPWLEVRVADVELPGGRHLDHRLVRTPPAVGVVVIDQRDRVLLIWRHRFITDTWAWELPLGPLVQGELPQAAAGRVFSELSGWRTEVLIPLLAVQPSNGLTDGLLYVYRGESPVYVGPPTAEAEGRVEWVPLSRIKRLVEAGEIVCGTTLSALLYVLLDHRPADDGRFDPGRVILLRDIPGLEL